MRTQEQYEQAREVLLNARRFVFMMIAALAGVFCGILAALTLPDDGVFPFVLACVTLIGVLLWVRWRRRMAHFLRSLDEAPKVGTE